RGAGLRGRAARPSACACRRGALHASAYRPYGRHRRAVRGWFAATRLHDGGAGAPPELHDAALPAPDRIRALRPEPSPAPARGSGLPGVGVLAAGGHRPGSQIIVATVAGTAGPMRFAFAGDIANALDGVRLEIPKPRLYSLLLVPEDRRRLAELRAFLRALGDLGVRVVVAHDLRALEASGIPPFAP